MLSDQIIEASQLFLLGMGTVFSLLLFLILCIRGLSLICKNVADEAVTKNTRAMNSGANAQEIAAVAAAVNAYRKNH